MLLLHICGNNMSSNCVYVTYTILWAANYARPCQSPFVHFDYERCNAYISVVIHQPYSMCVANAFHMTAKFNIFLFSPLDLRTSSGAPEQELNLHTTFGKFAKRLEHLSADLPLWIIELSVREWRTGSKRGPREISGISRNSQNYGLCGTRIKLRSG